MLRDSFLITQLRDIVTYKTPLIAREGRPPSARSLNSILRNQSKASGRKNAKDWFGIYTFKPDVCESQRKYIYPRLSLNCLIYIFCSQLNGKVSPYIYQKLSLNFMVYIFCSQLNGKVRPYIYQKLSLNFMVYIPFATWL